MEKFTDRQLDLIKYNNVPHTRVKEAEYVIDTVDEVYKNAFKPNRYESSINYGPVGLGIAGYQIDIELSFLGYGDIYRLYVAVSLSDVRHLLSVIRNTAIKFAIDSIDKSISLIPENPNF